MTRTQNVFRRELDTTDLLDDLRRTSIFRDLQDDELGPLVERVTEYQVPADQYVVQQDQPAEALFVVREGSVALVHDLIGAPVTSLACLHPGDFFGEMCIFGGIYPATVRATSQVRILRIRKKELAELARAKPLVEDALRQVAAERHSARIAAIVSLGRRREVRIRFCRRLPLIFGDGGEITTVLESLSLGGIGLKWVPETWEVGDTRSFGLRIRAQVLRLSGRVAWRHGERMGVELVKTHPNHDAMIQVMISWLREDIH